MKRMSLVGALLLALPTYAAGQVEIGLNGGLSWTSGEDRDTQTLFAIPFRDLHLGVPIGDRLVLEGFFILDRESDGNSTETLVGVLPGLTYLFSEAGGPRFYVRGEAGFEYANVESESVTQTGAGAAAGFRIPAGDSAFFRVEANFVNWFENDDVYGHRTFGIMVGFSAILK